MLIAIPSEIRRDVNDLKIPAWSKSMQPQRKQSEQSARIRRGSREAESDHRRCPSGRGWPISERHDRNGTSNGSRDGPPVGDAIGFSSRLDRRISRTGRADGATLFLRALIHKVLFLCLSASYCGCLPLCLSVSHGVTVSLLDRLLTSASALKSSPETHPDSGFEWIVIFIWTRDKLLRVSRRLIMTILSSIDSKSLASALDRAASGSNAQMASVQNAPFLANHHLMNFAVNLKSEFGTTAKSAAKRPHSSDGSDDALVKHPRSSSNSASSPTSSKPKIGFSIESIVGSRASPDIPANESGFHSVSPRPSSGTPVSVRSDQESIPDHPQSPPSSNHMFRADVAAAAAAGMMPAGWPQVPPPQMNPAYFEALAGMRNLYAQQQQQQQQQQQMMGHPSLMGAHPAGVLGANPMMAGSLPPSAGNHPWWLLAQARQQQQRLLAAAAVQRFPAGKFSHSNLSAWHNQHRYKSLSFSVSLFIPIKCHY